MADRDDVSIDDVINSIESVKVVQDNIKELTGQMVDLAKRLRALEEHTGLRPRRRRRTSREQ